MVVDRSSASRSVTLGRPGLLDLPCLLLWQTSRIQVLLVFLSQCRTFGHFLFWPCTRCSLLWAGPFWIWKSLWLPLSNHFSSERPTNQNNDASSLSRGRDWGKEKHWTRFSGIISPMLSLNAFGETKSEMKSGHNQIILFLFFVFFAALSCYKCLTF